MPETTNWEPPESDPKEHYVLRLYISGMTPRSMDALANLKAICEEYLSSRHTLEVIDIYRHPQRAKEDQIIAAPTLIKERPLPSRRFIGDLSDRARVTAGLNLLRKSA